ncbi:alkene reductase [Hydrocarboniphaga effusa]|uniref:alkene reductase n=1 Tax=Hydrocarboniphaga effusa TaxID=243629 RepID=UPI003137A6EF
MTLKLHTPTQLGELSLRNRIVMSPMTRTRNEPGHVPGALVVEHYADRADAGLIITECTSVSADASAFGDDPGIYNEAQVAGWKRVTDAVHAKGGLIALQIWHPGRATHPFINDGVVSISSTDRAIRDDGINTPKGLVPQANPRALRTDEIPGIVAQFKAGAENAKRAGFDAIQIHGAHGYLIDQFLRSSVNDRSDEYGGSIENRARLLLEITDAIIGVFGAGRVGVRISPLVAYNDISDADPQALVAYVAEQYARRGAGFFELRHNDHRVAEELELARIARARLGSVPLLRNGGYGGPDGDEDIVAGRADAIVYGKPFIANPDLVSRLASGAELNAVDFTTLYAGGAKGYNDYPRLAAS